MRPGNHCPHEASYRLGLGSCERRIDDHREAVDLAAIIGVSKHCEIVGRHAAITQVDRRQIRKPGHGIDLTSRKHRLAHGGTDFFLLHVCNLDSVLPRQRRPQPDRKVAVGDAERLPSTSEERVDGPAFTGNDGIGRLIEQHKHRLDGWCARRVAPADQFVDVDQREIAGIGGDARNRFRRSIGDIGRDRQTFRVEQSAR